MKTIYTAFLIFFTCHFVSAQAGEWVWLNGSNVPDAAGSHGTPGVPSATNEPPALYEPCEWTDTTGNFWLYGGINLDSKAYNDLWEYNPGTNEWTWMSGTNSLNDTIGSFGVRGVASPSNRPPSLGFGADSWVDLNGDFWLFGGGFVGVEFSALWKYDVSTNEWTWMKGPNKPNQPGDTGTKGVPDTANNPVHRSESAAAWTDNSGDLWLLGGDSRNDLWRYNIATNTWTWMKGSSGYYPTGVYGTMGVEDPANTPGERYVYSRWKDNDGNLWTFGGGDPSLFSQESDLWRYNPVTNNWTWMNGPNTADEGGIYGSQCTTASGNEPGSRWENRASWTDPNGNFWMWGGAAGEIFQDIWNDLWFYNVSTNQWTWMSGDSTPNPSGNWGIMGVASASNIPNGRAGAVGWTDNKGHLYIFGGTTNDAETLSPYNDIWIYTIDTTCAAVAVPPVASFQASDSSLCANGCINFTDLSTNATSWQWNFSGAIDSTSTSQDPQNICYRNTGIYNVTLTATNSSGSNTVTFTDYIDVNPSPPIPVITQSNDTLYCSIDPSYTGYQWYIDSALINGATNTFLVITYGGNYNVQVTNKYDCKIAGGINIVLGIQNFSNDNIISLSPNPAKNSLQLTIGNSGFAGLQIGIYNVLGQICQQSEIPNPKYKILVDVSSLSAGIYFVQLLNDNQRWTGRFVKE